MSISTAVTNASPIAIEHAFERVISTHLSNGRFLGERNRYSKSTIKRTDVDFHTGVSTFQKRQIEEYISASIITHCFDGWNFMSRAIESVLAGDEMTAIHMAYYAELRSVMSLMACNGIGIFNSRHVYFDVNKTPFFFGSSTHPVASEGIKEWKNNSPSKSLVFDIIKVRSRTLTDWIVATSYSHRKSITDILFDDWLSSWSIDLDLKRDRNLRNEISYRPKLHVGKIECKDVLRKITEIWPAFEPTGGDNFSLLDKHLLRIVLDKIFQNARPSKDRKTFLQDTVRKLGLTMSESDMSFLLREIADQDHLIIKEAKKEVFNNSTHTYDCFPIICRALLLLRLSTGIAGKFLRNSTIEHDMLQFWWSKIGLNVGLWTDTSKPSNFDDLYEDISNAIDTIDFDNAASWLSQKDAARTYSEPFFVLKQFQRVGLWGLAV